MSYPAKKVEDEPVTGTPVGVSAPPVQGAVGEWSTGLCDCFEDFGNCCLTCWCPCITFGRIAEIVDRGSTSCGTSGALYALIMSLTGCQWIYSWMYRSKLRAEYNLPESPCCDCCIHFCCEPCALCQQHRELTNRGFDVALGWNLNMERRGGGGAVNPPGTQQGMTR
uniref:Uncharacterized protein n=1 Tax=Ananas comosus var. bracteatus TaxID=296719 RepID=A0A6V7P782_ANACO|nr:unnamed protein product [Ananas comosus var. bracteatus]